MKKSVQIGRKVNARTVAQQPHSGTVQVPGNWEEVAYIDFTGLHGYDNGEAIVYKTSECTLAVMKTSETGQVAIEVVTRNEVLRWLLECVVPAEFRADFRDRATANNSDSGKPRMSREEFDAQTQLECEVFRASGLAEGLAALFCAADKSEEPLLSDRGADGMKSIAYAQSNRLQAAHDKLFHVRNGKVAA